MLIQLDICQIYSIPCYATYEHEKRPILFQISARCVYAKYTKAQCTIYGMIFGIFGILRTANSPDINMHKVFVQFYRQYDELFHQWFSLSGLTGPLNLFISNESNDCLRTHQINGNPKPFHLKGISSLTCMTCVWFKYSIWTKFKYFKSLLCIELQTEITSFSVTFLWSNSSYFIPVYGVCVCVNSGLGKSEWVFPLKENKLYQNS